MDIYKNSENTKKNMYQILVGLVYEILIVKGMNENEKSFSYRSIIRNWT